jgi:molecular chaperone GrpE
VQEDTSLTENDSEDLEALLEAAKEKADENWANLLLAKAEVENIRRRSQKDIEKAHRFSIEKFAKDLLSVVDSFEMGLAATEDAAEDVTAIKEGLELTYKQLLSALEKSNITQVDPNGEAFNPEHHQAMSMVPSADHEPNTVIQVFQKGYLLNERLLRPAMVIVSQAAPAADS